VGDVVADMAQLIEQAPDLIEHQVDVARDAVEVVGHADHRQALLEVAFHDLGDGGVDDADAAAGAAGEEDADRQDQQGRRRQGEGQRARHRLAQVVDLGKALAKDEDRAVDAAHGDEDRLIGASGPAQGRRGGEMGAAVDANRRQTRRVAEQ